MTLFNKFQKLQNSKSSQCFDLLELRCRYWSPVQTSRGGGGSSLQAALSKSYIGLQVSARVGSELS